MHALFSFIPSFDLGLGCTNLSIRQNEYKISQLLGRIQQPYMSRLRKKPNSPSILSAHRTPRPNCGGLDHCIPYLFSCPLLLLLLNHFNFLPHDQRSTESEPSVGGGDRIKAVGTSRHENHMQEKGKS